jgi:hypothetical protein
LSAKYFAEKEDFVSQDIDSVINELKYGFGIFIAKLEAQYSLESIETPDATDIGRQVALEIHEDRVERQNLRDMEEEAENNRRIAHERRAARIKREAEDAAKEAADPWAELGKGEA